MWSCLTTAAFDLLTQLELRALYRPDGRGSALLYVGMHSSPGQVDEDRQLRDKLCINTVRPFTVSFSLLSYVNRCC